MYHGQINHNGHDYEVSLLQLGRGYLRHGPVLSGERPAVWASLLSRRAEADLLSCQALAKRAGPQALQVSALSPTDHLWPPQHWPAPPPTATGPSCQQRCSLVVSRALAALQPWVPWLLPIQVRQHWVGPALLHHLWMGCLFEQHEQAKATLN